MSVTNGGTALKPCSRGGRFSGSAGSAGISITFRTAHLLFLPPSSRYHIQMEDERSFREMTTPTNPKVFRSEEHTSELQSRFDVVCRLLLEKKNTDSQADSS